MNKNQIILGTLLIVVMVFGVIFFNNETKGGGNKNVGTGGTSGGGSGSGGTSGGVKGVKEKIPATQQPTELTEDYTVSPSSGSGGNQSAMVPNSAGGGMNLVM